MTGFYVFLWSIWMFAIGFLAGYPVKSERLLLERASVVIEECEKDLPRSQVCELTAKVKEGKE